MVYGKSRCLMCTFVCKWQYFRHPFNLVSSDSLRIIHRINTTNTPSLSMYLHSQHDCTIIIELQLNQDQEELFIVFLIAITHVLTVLWANFTKTHQLIILWKLKYVSVGNASKRIEIRSELLPPIISEYWKLLCTYIILTTKSFPPGSGFLGLIKKKLKTFVTFSFSRQFSKEGSFRLNENPNFSLHKQP